MKTIANFVAVMFLALFAATAPAAETRHRDSEARFVVELPDVVLTDVPVDWMEIKALDINGDFDPSYNGRPLILGIRLSVIERGGGGSFTMRDDAELPPFVDGVLRLTTDLPKGRKVYVTRPEIVIDPESRGKTTESVVRTQRWFALLPPLLAIGLAVWLRNVVFSLFAAVWCGAAILSHGNLFVGFVRTVDTYLVGELVQVSEDGAADATHLMIVFFTMLLGAMVGVMSHSGGTQALVNRLARVTSNREHTQITTWGLGMLIFFDDYANTLLVGSTMRPVTDRLKISREKLAFIVDSTAAPVAGLAIISTWVGVEIGYIRDTYQELFQGSGYEWDAYSTFLATIPYRFYPLHLLVFVWLISYSGHDYGPMLKAETRAIALDQPSRPDAVVPTTEFETFEMNESARPLVRNALVPVSLLVGLILTGMWWTGIDGLAERNLELAQQGKPELSATLWRVMSSSDATRVLFLSSFVASIAAVATAVTSHSLSIRESMNAWAAGAKSMFFAVLILILAWTVATICDREHLNTAGFLVEIAHGRISSAWMPTLAFVLSAAVSFATGSSWSTMGLLMPLFISFTFYVLAGTNDVGPNQPIMLATIGGVLAGAIFGDHCSPISDTTVLSSAASGCDHLHHVSTQIPYAVTVGVVSLLLGYIPVGFGYSPVLLLPSGLITLFVVVQFLGQPAEKHARIFLKTYKPERPKRADGEEGADDPAEDEPAPADSAAASS